MPCVISVSIWGDAIRIEITSNDGAEPDAWVCAELVNAQNSTRAGMTRGLGRAVIDGSIVQGKTTPGYQFGLLPPNSSDA
jgi:hypothetical protein